MAFILNTYWFDWGAFATAAAGGAAVWAARSVGIKQAEITQDQVRLGVMANRISLLQQRVEVWAATRNYLLSAIQTAERADDATRRLFYNVLPVAEFLFDENVHRALLDADRVVLRFEDAHRQYQRGVEAGAPAQEVIEREHALFEEALSKLEGLTALFAPYLSVSTDLG